MENLFFRVPIRVVPRKNVQATCEPKRRKSARAMISLFAVCCFATLVELVDTCTCQDFSLSM